MNLLECGGKRSATPLSSGSQASRITWRTGGSHQVGKSAVAASLCRRSPKSVTKDVAESIFRRRFADDVAQSPADALKEIIAPRSARSVQGLYENYRSRPENCSAVSRTLPAPHRGGNTILAGSRFLSSRPLRYRLGARAHSPRQRHDSAR